MLCRIDSFLIDQIFQPVSNKFQRLTGRDCFFLAKTSFFMVIPNMIAVILLMPVGIMKFWPISSIIIFAVGCFLLLVGIMIREISLIENLDFSKCANPERVEVLTMLLRLVFTLGLAYFVGGAFSMHFDSIAIGLLFHQALLWAGFYFTACTPLPPCKSWVKIFVEKLKMAVGEVVTPSPEPVKVQ